MSDLNFIFARPQIQKKILYGSNTTRKALESEFVRPILHDSYNNGRNLWLVKPIGYNRGRGIRIFDNLPTLQSQLKDYYQGIKEDKILQKKSVQSKK